MKFNILIVLFLLFAANFAYSQLCFMNDTCSVPEYFENSIMFRPDCDSCDVDSASFYYLFEVNDMNQSMVIRDFGVDPSYGQHVIDFEVYYMGQSYDYCDTVSNGDALLNGNSVYDTIVSTPFSQTGYYLIEINTLFGCPEVYLALTDSSCNSNSGALDGDYNCQSGTSLFDGYSQSFGNSNYDCWLHWYNLCIVDTTEMTVNINRSIDSSFYTFWLIDGYLPDSVNCDFLESFSESMILGGDDNIQLDTLVIDSIPAGNYTVVFFLSSESENIGNFVDLNFSFDNQVDQCELAYQCPDNDTCIKPIEVNNCHLFTGFCDTCAVSVNNYFFSFDVQEDNSFIVINEQSGSGAYSYVLTRWDTLLDPCNMGYLIDTIVSGIDSSEVSIIIDSSGYYLLELDSIPNCPNFEICQIHSLDSCESCIGSFAPVPGNRYLIGAWVHDETAHDTITTFDSPEIYIHFTENDNGVISSSSIGPFTASGNIIDGWQRIEEMFTIPINAIDIQIELTTTSDSALFDDVRMFPYNASMKTFVYDPVNMRLSSELDERHYATFYEYDEEGKLVRIKKETEKGIMTIQETKSNSSK